MIREVIVVEGRDDEAAVKRAVDAEVIITSGLGIEEKTIERIRYAQQKTGVIILTDPDFPGEKIRKIISERVPGCKHAYLPKKYSIKDNDVGVENATPEHIREALERVKTQGENRQLFTLEHMIDAGLVMGDSSRIRREKLGDHLGIGYANAKQFLKRLNHYSISLEEFQEALEWLERSGGQ
ncbi:ribonuclease M5 [Irregularibacter muris]|uniref:Ribonuclease M5 n=1 Tax=Irregularibacter muris TaxID=1796619 RepID=A0AAE3L2Y2_9FIRM|nr:ribonuclease M5 [Irregularibacter muris]MCR1899519.1 ribonuclease M5 [Irregularibacter muris]